MSDFALTFQRSIRGNLWREYDGATISVFCRNDGGYSWCIAYSDDSKQFGERYDTEEDAMDGLEFMVDQMFNF